MILDPTFEQALEYVSELAQVKGYLAAIRHTHKEGHPHIMVYIDDDIFANGFYKEDLPDSIELDGETYGIGVAPQSKVIDLFLAVWKVHEDD